MQIDRVASTPEKSPKYVISWATPPESMDEGEMIIPESLFEMTRGY